MDTIPKFSRVEIRTRGNADLMIAAQELRALANDLEAIAKAHDDTTSPILAHHAIRATSQKLRGKQ